MKFWKIPFKRKQYIVDRGAYQARFLLPFVASWLLATVASVVFFNLLAENEIEALLWSAHVSVESTDQVIGKVFVYSIVFTSLLICIFLTISCWYVRRKTTGVAIRLVKDLRMVADGDFSKRIWLRKNDQFQDVAAAINDFIGARGEHYRGLQEDFTRLNETLQRLRLAQAKHELQSTDLAVLKEQIRVLRCKVAQVENDLSEA